MCFSKSLSLKSFLFGIISASLLIYFGNTKSNNENLAIGIFFIFVSIMQLIEYFIWSDMKCKNGLNKLGSLLGPLFNHFQPVILLLLCNKYIISNGLIPNKFLVFINIIYIVYVLYKYLLYIKDNKNLCIGLNKDNHLDWTWKYDFNYLFYYIILIINLANFINNKNIIIVVIVSCILLIISYFGYNNNLGEFWCLFVTCVPLVNLFFQKVFNINN
jgi:hypothetical protein